MKTPASLLFLVALYLGAPAAHALGGVGRVGDRMVSIPVTIVEVAEFDLPTGDILDGLAAAATTPPPAGDLTELKKYPPFNTLPNDPAVVDRLSKIPLAAIDAVEVIRRDNSTAGDALTYLLNNRRLSLAFGGLPGADSEVRDDGSPRYGSEAIDLYWVPQPLVGQAKINLYDIDGVRLTHTLANYGQYMTTPGFEGKPPQTTTESINWALTNQLRSLSVSSNAVERLAEAVEVFSNIVANLAVPTNITGIARSLGRQLLNDTSLTDPAKQQKARDLLAYIQGELQPREKWELSARVYYKDTLQLTLSGKLSSANGYNEPFKKAGYFVDTVRKPGTAYPYTTYFGGYATVTNPTTTAAIVLDNRFWRMTGKSDGTRENEAITVPELGGITMGGFDGTRLYIGGPSPNFSQFIAFGYLDSDGDGRVEAGTKRQLFTSPNFINGAHLGWNPATGMGVVLDRATRNLYQFTGSGADGFATNLALKGSLGNGLTDTWRFGISYDGQWLMGFPEFKGTLSRFYQHTESYLDPGVNQYQAMRTGYTFEESRLNAAAAGPIETGGRPMKFTGTPDTQYRASIYDMGVWTQKATATTDPYGNGYFYIPGTDIALKVGARIRYDQLDGSEASPDYTITAERPKPLLFEPKLRNGDLRVSFNYEPNTSVTLERATSFSGFAPVETNKTTEFGYGCFSDCLPYPALSSFYAWRAAALSPVSSGTIDYYYLPPGVRRTLYPAWNDLLRPGGSFTLDNPTGLATSIMLGVTMDPVTSAFLGTVATFSNNPLLYRLYQNAVFIAAYQTVIIPDLKRLKNPPILLGPGLSAYVPLRCLVINGQNYPVMQFRLAYPESPPPPAGCTDAHWHGDRVYHIGGDTVGIIDPFPSNCGFGSYLAVPQVDVPIPFLDWLIYRAYFLDQIAASQPVQLNEAVCGPEPVGK